MKELSRARLCAFTSLSLATSLALAGCDDGTDSGRGARVGEPLGQAESGMKVCPGMKTVRGIDVSQYQETIDWNQVAASGIKFAIARKSYGTGHLDPTFDANWQGMKAAGIIRGAYQWVRPGQSITAQADIMISALGKLGPGDLPAMADIEEAGTLTKAQYAAKVQQWLDLVEAGTGKKPMIYTGSYFWDANVASNAFQGYPLIDAAYLGACYSSTTGFVAANDCWVGSCPTISNAFDDWQFWQYSSQTHVPGISKFDYVDMDLFNGDMDALALLAGSAYAAEVVKVDVPATIGLGQTAMGHVTVKNVGVSAWDTGTKLGTTGPRDRTSELAGTDWDGPNRAGHVAVSVAPGDTYTFDFSLVAPAKLGVYKEDFGLVEESVAWFADQGGPADDAISFTIEVVDAPVGTTGSTGSSSTSTGGVGGNGGAGGDGGGVNADGSCSCRVASSGRAGEPVGRSDTPASAFVGLLALSSIAGRRLGRRSPRR